MVEKPCIHVPSLSYPTAKKAYSPTHPPAYPLYIQITGTGYGIGTTPVYGPIFATVGKPSTHPPTHLLPTQCHATSHPHGVQ